MSLRRGALPLLTSLAPLLAKPSSSTSVLGQACGSRVFSVRAYRQQLFHFPGALRTEAATHLRAVGRLATTMATKDTSGGSSGESKITDWVRPGDTSGEFKRQQSSFRHHISREPGAQFPPEKGRYHLYVSYACPWATRTLIARKLKGLEDIISFSAVHWHLGPKGWRFATREDTDAAGENVIPDPVHEGFTHLQDVYFQANPSYEGRFTVPVLYDKKRQTIVNNESSEILRMLGTEFDDLIGEKYRQVHLYPEHLRAQIDEAHEWHYDKINNGVYKAGFATTQEAYERNVVALFDALDRAEAHLAKTASEGPYWFGQTLTEVDIRLFVTIIRFDPVYVQHFKCNLRDIRSGYPALHRWLRRLYWTQPAFGGATNFPHIKKHYTRSHTQINPLSITPLGPVPDILPPGDEVAAARAAAAAAGQ